jgi:hypothetical protein
MENLIYILAILKVNINVAKEMKAIYSRPIPDQVFSGRDSVPSPSYLNARRQGMLFLSATCFSMGKGKKGCHLAVIIFISFTDAGISVYLDPANLQ